MKDNNTGAHRMCGFPEAIRRGMSQYASFQGRATRAELWWFFLFSYIVTQVASCVGEIGVFLMVGKEGKAGVGPALCLYGLVMLSVAVAVTIPLIAVGVRRLHDIGKSGAHYWLYLIPFYGMVVYIINGCKDSDRGTNAYGPSEKYPD